MRITPADLHTGAALPCRFYAVRSTQRALGFILRSLAPRWWIWGIAAYAFRFVFSQTSPRLSKPGIRRPAIGSGFSGKTSC